MLKSRLLSHVHFDNQSLFAMERVNSAEKQFADLCCAFAGLSRKTAQVRDKNDELARLFKGLGDGEKYNKTLSQAMQNFSKALTLLADQRDLEVQRIEKRVVAELADYEIVCRNTRDDLKCSTALHKDKGISRKKQIEQLRQKRAQIERGGKMSSSDSVRFKVSMEMLRTSKDVQEVMELFERQKVHDLKTCLRTFVEIQLRHHSKALEVLTAVYQNISEIDETKDLAHIKKYFDMENDSEENVAKLSSRSQSIGALTSMFNISTSSRSALRRRASVSSISSSETSSLKQKPNAKDATKDKSNGEADDSSIYSEDDIKVDPEEDSDKIASKPVPHSIKLKEAGPWKRAPAKPTRRIIVESINCVATRN